MFFQISAVVILLLFYGCYFIKMLEQRKKGICTNQMGKGKTGAVKAIELTLRAATLIVPVVELISIILNTSAFPGALRITGIMLGLAGDAVFIAAVVQMHDSWRAGVPESDKTELVTSGIFSISRNPAFLGFDLVYIGILLMFYNHALFAASVFASLCIHLQIVNVEEDFLQNAFGEEYLSYKKRVSRYLGMKNGTADKRI